MMEKEMSAHLQKVVADLRESEEWRKELGLTREQKLKLSEHITKLLIGAYKAGYDQSSKDTMDFLDDPPLLDFPSETRLIKATVIKNGYVEHTIDWDEEEQE